MKNKLIFLQVSLLILTVNLLIIFIFARFERLVYIVFYFHVASAWVSYLTFIISLIGHVGYLKKKNINWYFNAKNSIKIGLVFTFITLVTGSIWFNATSGNYQNIFWQWSDPRQTTTLILFISYLGYLLYSSFIEDMNKRAKISSYLGILLFLMVPLSYISAVVFNSLHPVINPNPGETGNIYWDAIKLVALFLNLIGLTLFYVYILSQFLEIEHLKREHNEILYRELEE